LPQRATKKDILSVVGDVCYIQWDPIDAVAPSHIISFWSRLGNFRQTDLEKLLWNEKNLFLHWNPASIVLSTYYPLLYSLMRRYPESISDSWGIWKRRAREFLPEHKELRKRVLNELKGGPLSLKQFRDHVPTGRSADGWSSGSDVSTMLFHLQMTGDVMVVGHEGNQNVWGLCEQFMPTWSERKELTEEEFEKEAAQRVLRALGTASPREIFYYFPRARYLHIDKALEHLEQESLIHRVQVAELGERDERYVHHEDMELLESMTTDAWHPRTTLLAPFDNLTCDQGRTERLFRFRYIHENFLPKSKRKFGTFVHPILWGDKLIGRADLYKDKANEKLLVHSVHAETHAPSDKEIASKIAETIQELAEFLGMKDVVYTAKVPAAWKNSLS
jgi:uncharacterized protein